MEELKILIDMVAKLPSMALWVLVGFFAYKVCIIGSIYGVIRLFIVKLHDWLTTPQRQQVQLEVLLDGLCISNQKEAMMSQLRRIVGRGLTIPTEFIHRQSVDWLREAIDDKIAKEQAK